MSSVISKRRLERFGFIFGLIIFGLLSAECRTMGVGHKCVCFRGASQLNGGQQGSVCHLCLLLKDPHEKELS